MFTLVFLILPFGNIGVQVVHERFHGSVAAHVLIPVAEIAFSRRSLYTIQLTMKHDCVIHDADISEPTCYSRFDYEMRLFETVAETKQDHKILMNTMNNLQDVIETLEAKVDAQEQLIQDQAVSISKYHESLQSIESTSTYVRWGRTSCPNNGTTLIYEGHAGGSFYSQTGSGADYQCLPKDPTWGVHLDGMQGNKAYMFGAEYDPGSLHFDSLTRQDVPCAVCLTTRSTSIMIPARTSCYPGWTLEYEGNLVSEHYKHQRTQYICIDKEAESAPGSDPTDDNGAMIYAVEGRCGSLHCPPYVEGRELACVVCSK